MLLIGKSLNCDRLASNSIHDIALALCEDFAAKLVTLLKLIGLFPANPIVRRLQNKTFIYRKGLENIRYWPPFLHCTPSCPF